MKVHVKKSAIKPISCSGRWWLRKLLNMKPGSSYRGHALLLSVLCSFMFATIGLAVEGPSSDLREPSPPPANHKMDEGISSQTSNNNKSRHGRQYDSNLGASSTGSYASISGDSAYVGQSPSSNYASSPLASAAVNYASDLAGGYHSASHYDPMSMSRGYPMPPMSSVGNYPSAGSMSSLFSNGPMSGLASASGPSGLLSSGSMFPLMGKSFDVSEIICTAIAVAIGAVIVGAPFILIYLFVVNQMNGNGPSMSPTSGGAISLTGPTSSTTVSGRKKRHTSFPEALLKQISPFVNSEQVAQSFKLLLSSIAKYQS